jgi:outer membrane protein TolC
LESKPSINQIKLAQSKAVLQENLADYSNYPDFQIGLQYTQRDYNNITGIDYKDFLSVIVGVTLPLNYGGKNRAIIEEAKQSQKFYTEEYNSKKIELMRSINKIYEKLDLLMKRRELFEKELIPQSKKAFSSSLNDYKVDKTDFTNVIKAQNDLLKTELKYADIINEYYKSISDLEYQIGADIYNEMEY